MGGRYQFKLPSSFGRECYKPLSHVFYPMILMLAILFSHSHLGVKASYLGKPRRNTAGTDPVNYRTLDCQSCIAQGGRQCLLDGEWTYAVCCSPDPEEASYFCRTQELVYCASEDTISNEVLQDFVCPAERDRCPSIQSDIEINLETADLASIREYKWDYLFCLIPF